MSSLVTSLNSSTAQEIVNRITTADGCVHTADASRVGGVYWALVHSIDLRFGLAHAADAENKS